MLPQDIIKTKRDGGALSQAQIQAWIDGVVGGAFTDYQSTALLMAILLNGMDGSEIAALTEAMLHSGDVLDLGEVPGLKVDKHSTGGIGDKVSLILAPWVAACGVPVPMMSGRGLGITGGTLDKLESIPGFRVDLDEATFRQQVGTLGCAQIGQTARLAPADRTLYALRDASATVESIPLIAASIMSKKLAEGIDALVLDVKFGSGAFMKDLDRARALAQTLVGISKTAGKPVRALLTRMDEPLGRAVGNAVEVAESIESLRGRGQGQGQGPADLMEVTEALAVEMLLLGEVAQDADTAKDKLQEALSSGAALEKFRTIIEAQGGDARVCDDLSRLPQARSIEAIPFEGTGGTVQAVDAEKIGEAARLLGAGRAKAEDPVDPAVGIDQLAKVGETLDPGQALCRLHLNDPKQRIEAIQLIQAAFTVSTELVTPNSRIVERL